MCNLNYNVRAFAKAKGEKNYSLFTESHRSCCSSVFQLLAVLHAGNIHPQKSASTRVEKN